MVGDTCTSLKVPRRISSEEILKGVCVCVCLFSAPEPSPNRCLGLPSRGYSLRSTSTERCL